MRTRVSLVEEWAAARAAALRERLNAVLARRGAPGVAYGQSSTFCLLLGVDAPVARLDASTLKRGVAGALSATLHCSMLLHGVHLFHGYGFLSDAHTDGDLALTIDAFDATISRLQEEGLLAC